jgi:predicted kinase
MPKLILLNGPPASGKSTLARLFVENHPLALNLDIDRLCALVGGWPRHHEAFGLARRIAVTGASTHLGGGHDVIVPQFVAQTAFIEELRTVALAHHADFHELVLLEPKPAALRRFADRTATSRAPEHHVAAEMLQEAGGPIELAAMYDRLLDVLANRQQTKIIQPTVGDIDATYRDLVTALS